MAKSILFTGASYSAGDGIPGGISHPGIWPNLVADHLGITDVTNASVPGSNNVDIFVETLHQITTKQFDLVLIGWATIPVYSYHVGLELYNTRTNLRGDRSHKIINQKVFGKQWLNGIAEKLLTIHNDHWDILELVKYVNILHAINPNVYHINMSMSFIQRGFFERKEVEFPSMYDPLTRDILNVDARDDSESFALYSMIHDQYEKYGGILEDKWLNLYDALELKKIDVVSRDDPHPGLESQRIFADIILKRLMNAGEINKHD